MGNHVIRRRDNIQPVGAEVIDRQARDRGIGRLDFEANNRRARVGAIEHDPWRSAAARLRGAGDDNRVRDRGQSRLQLDCLDPAAADREIDGIDR